MHVNAVYHRLALPLLKKAVLNERISFSKIIESMTILLVD